MYIRIALVGALPDDTQTAAAVDLLLGEIKGHFQKTSADAQIQLLFADGFTGPQWKQWNAAHQFPVYAFCSCADSCFLTGSDTVRFKHTDVREMLSDDMLDIADIILAVWNEDPMEMDCATWDLLQLAYARHIPCVWHSVKTRGAYCLWDSFYRSYSAQYLEQNAEPLPDALPAPRPVTAHEQKLIPHFWIKLRRRYLRKHNAEQTIHDSALDTMMQDSFRMENESAETLRAELLEQFHRFDSDTMQRNEWFLSMLYQRSVLPLVTTVFLAVGFYAETLIGKTSSLLFPEIGDAVNIAAILLAGIGFFIHAALNYYVYRLSRSATVRSWQQDFTSSRFLAEAMRAMLHFLPFGIELDMRRLCGSRKTLSAQLRHLTDDLTPKRLDCTRESTRECLVRTDEMLADQLAYHERSVRRYENIVTSLEKWGRIILYTGFGMVLLRGVLQFVLVAMVVNTKVNNIAGLLSSDETSILRSFLNMLALLLPAWAGYFSTKLSLNQYRFNLDNHKEMHTRLSQLRERVKRTLDDERIPMEVSGHLAEEIAETLLEDTARWQVQYLNSTIKPL